jgi:acyl-CoA reductase-like NAD-dependent aldehyde dehydrogenase
MLRISGSHLPPAIAVSGECVVAEHEDVRITVPDLDAADLDRVCTALIEARRRLRTIPVTRVVQAVDAAARRLLDRNEAERRLVLRSLNAISGFSDAMAEHVLDRIAQDWRTPALEQLLRAELGGHDALESFAGTGDGRRMRAVAPPLGLHVLSGNVPGIGVTSIVRALLVRSAVLAKSAAVEPALTPAFARMLAHADPEVGACVAVTYWRGGDTSLEDAALQRVGLVVHYGGVHAIDALRDRAPAGVRFVEHGPRISFALIDASAAGATLECAARDLARATALFDQQGCVSPQLAYVIGTRAQARHIAGATAAALGDIQAELPRGTLSPAEAAAIRELRTRAEFDAIAGGGTELWAGGHMHYTVILAPDDRFEGSCLNRTLLIKHVPDLTAILSRVEPFRTLLQTVGIAGFHGDAMIHAAAALGDAGATRITSIADMPWPPPAWHHDGRGPLRELIRWVDLEPRD